MEQQLTVSTLQETVTVSGQSPVVDATHAGTSTNLNQETLPNIPTSRSQFFDVVPMAPGHINQCQRLGGSSFNVFGSNTNQNAIQYDGIDISSPNFGGCYDWPNYDMMSELQVKSVGASAAPDRVPGRRHQPGAEVGQQPAARIGELLRPVADARQQHAGRGVPATVDHRLDYNYTLGGPIKKDRIWVWIGQHIREPRRVAGRAARPSRQNPVWRRRS